MMSMKGGRDEGSRIGGPLFPRLHVNDEERTGPRPPPRNKMAFYERFSIPTERFSNASVSSVSTLAKMASPSKGDGKERGVFSPVQSSFPLGRSSGGRSSCSTDELLVSTYENSNKKPMITARSGNLDVTESSLPTMRCSSFRPCNPSQFKRPFIQRDGANPGATNLSHPGMSLDSSINQSGFVEEIDLVDTSSSLQFQPTVLKRLKRPNAADVESEGHARIPSKEGLKSPQASQDHYEHLTLVSQARDNKPLAGDKPAEMSSEGPTSSSGQHKSSEQVNKVPSGGVVEQLNVSAMSKASLLRSKSSCNQSPLTDVHHISVNVGPGNGNQHLQSGNECGPLPAGVLYKNVDPSHTSAVDCVSSAVLSPDELVGMIGQEHFWKARRAIIDQQRVFSMQVFELHRIIKVQRIIASSAHLQQQSKASNEPSPTKESSPKSVQEPPTAHVKPRDVSEKPPLPLLNNDDTPPGPNMGKPEATLPCVDDRLAISCLPPPPPPPGGNLWLVPVMSPSEGLIYKPYTGSCPPPGGFVATLYGTCGPTNATTPTTVDFPNIPLPMAASPVGPTFFAPPYGMPVMGPPQVYSLTVEQITAKQDPNNFGAAPPPYQSLCIIGGEPKGGDQKQVFQSTASSPKRNSSSDAILPLFPTAPTVLDTERSVLTHSTNEKKTQAIRVIPCKARLSSESAARIFQLIKDERKHLYD